MESKPTGAANRIDVEDSSPLASGDKVYHPRYGLGTIHGVTLRERIQPLGAPAPDPASEGQEEYYDIELVEGGMLQVPVSRAEGIGLRRASNGLDKVRLDLQSTAEGLPENARERAGALRLREQEPQPEALANSVRDMLAHSQGRNLSAGERTWLERACQRLSAEVAFVDKLSLAQARSAIWEVVTQLTGRARSG